MRAHAFGPAAAERSEKHKFSPNTKCFMSIVSETKNSRSMSTANSIRASTKPINIEEDGRRRRRRGGRGNTGGATTAVASERNSELYRENIQVRKLKWIHRYVRCVMICDTHVNYFFAFGFVHLHVAIHLQQLSISMYTPFPALRLRLSASVRLEMRQMRLSDNTNMSNMETCTRGTKLQRCRKRTVGRETISSCCKFSPQK